MSDVNDAVPAGTGEGEAAPTNVSMDAAVDMWTRSEEEQAGQAEQTEVETTEGTEAPEETAAAVGEEEPEGGEAEAATEEPEGTEEEESGEDNDAPIPLEKLHGNTKVRLRDGTEWTVGELKRRIDDLRGLDTHKQEFAAHQQQFREHASKVAQQAQFFEQIAPRAIAAIQAQLPTIPDEPDLALRSTDPFAYSEAVDDRRRAIEDYNRKVAEIQQIEHQQQQIAHQRQQETAQHQQAFLVEQQGRFIEMNPDLREQGARDKFHSEFFEFGQKSGFSVHELNNVFDARTLTMARKAMKYDQLMAAKPKPGAQNQQKTGAPVAQPGRRVGGAEAKRAKIGEQFQRARKQGGLSLDEAAALAQQLED